MLSIITDDEQGEYFEEDIPRVLGHYKILTKINEGSSGKVYEAYDKKHNVHVALKFVSRSYFNDNDQLIRFENETRIFASLHHPNIAQYYETIFLEDYIVISMELLMSGSLRQLLNNPIVTINDHDIIRWASDILEALCYLHKKGIVHRDIKPENIGFDEDMNLKIFDFGLSNDLSVKSCSSACGTPYFVAPEVILEPKYDGKKADIWSFGITVHYMITGRFPFPDMTFGQFCSRAAHLQDYITIDVGEKFYNLVSGALVIDPHQRKSARELLQDPIFRTNRLLINTSKDVSKSCPQSLNYNQIRAIMSPPVATRRAQVFHGIRPRIVYPKRTRELRCNNITMLC